MSWHDPRSPQERNERAYCLESKKRAHPCCLRERLETHLDGLLCRWSHAPHHGPRCRCASWGERFCTAAHGRWRGQSESVLRRVIHALWRVAHPRRFRHAALCGDTQEHHVGLMRRRSGAADSCVVVRLAASLDWPVADRRTDSTTIGAAVVCKAPTLYESGLESGVRCIDHAELQHTAVCSRCPASDAARSTGRLQACLPI